MRAILLMRRSNSRQVRVLPSHITARLSGQARGVARHADRDRDELGKVAQRRLRHQKRCRDSCGLAAYFFGSTFSTGPPAFFQAPKPPSRCATGVSPMSCAVLVASAERQAPAQKNTNLLPLWK